MKIIDLLNKIANGEEVPKKIRINNIIYEYQGDDYLFKDKNNDNHEYWLFSDGYPDKFQWLDNFLKTEVEEDIPISKLYINNELQYSLEEEHKIPEKIEYHQVRRNEVEVDYIEDGIVKHFCLNKKQRYFADKINEILDYFEAKNE